MLILSIIFAGLGAMIIEIKYTAIVYFVNFILLTLPIPSLHFEILE
jgi:hypothetical protein